jgi:hypothetical protein
MTANTPAQPLGDPEHADHTPHANNMLTAASTPRD